MSIWVALKATSNYLFLWIWTLKYTGGFSSLLFPSAAAAENLLLLGSTTKLDYSSYILDYYKASFVSGDDEPNCALWLATRAGKMELSWPLGMTRHVLREKFSRKPNTKSFIGQAFSVMMAAYWPSFFYFVVNYICKGKAARKCLEALEYLVDMLKVCRADRNLIEC